MNDCIEIENTSYGLIVDLIKQTNCKIYLDKYNNCVKYSFDKNNWQIANKELSKELLNMSQYINNITINRVFKGDLENV